MRRTRSSKGKTRGQCSDPLPLPPPLSSVPVLMSGAAVPRHILRPRHVTRLLCSSSPTKPLLQVRQLRDGAAMIQPPSLPLLPLSTPLTCRNSRKTQTRSAAVIVLQHLIASHSRRVCSPCPHWRVLHRLHFPSSAPSAGGAVVPLHFLGPRRRHVRPAGGQPLRQGRVLPLLQLRQLRDGALCSSPLHCRHPSWQEERSRGGSRESKRSTESKQPPDCAGGGAGGAAVRAAQLPRAHAGSAGRAER